MSDNFDNSTLPVLDWSLDIFSPLGAFVKTVTQATSPNPVMGSPSAMVDNCGRTVELRFNAKQSLVGIEPRQVVRYKAAPGSVAVAAGVVVTCPPTDSPGAGPADGDDDALQRISCVGLEQLLRESIVGPDAVWDENVDVSTIAYTICNDYAHPALVIDQDNFPNAGFQVGSWYAPYSTLLDALEGLLRQVPGGGCVYVNADREVIWAPAAQFLPT